MSENRPLDIFTYHTQIANKQTNIFGSLIDHVYIKKNLIKMFFTGTTAEIIYFSDHDVIKIVFEENAVYFHTIL